MRRVSLTFFALVLASCGGAAATGDTDTKTRGSEPRDGRTPTVDARPARADDFAIRVRGRSPVAPITRPGAYVVQVEILNRSLDPILVGPSWIQTTVLRDALLVPQCANSTPREVELDEIVRGAGSTATVVPLPCALPEPGLYRVVAVLMTKEDPNASLPDRALASGTMRLLIEAR